MPVVGHLQERAVLPWVYRADIEGLRAVAVVAVVLFHADVPVLRGGFVGVDVFFVISGFLITGLLWREVGATGAVRLRRFYAARARRLLPASALVGVITMIGSIVFLPPLQVPLVIYDGIFSALYVGNYWFVLADINYFSDLLTPSPFLHYWSLGVEEQFYLLWAPLFLGMAWIVRRRRRRISAAASSPHRPFVVLIALVAVLSFGLSLLITYVVPALAFFSLPTRAWQLALGGLVALTAVHWQRLSRKSASTAGWFGLGLIALACLWFDSATPFPGFTALLPTMGAVLVIGAGCAAASHGCGRLVGSAPMQTLGRISYSWYLWHWPVLVLAPELFGRPLNLAERLTAVLLSAALAWLTWKFVENPLRYAAAVRKSAWRGLAIGGGVTAIVVCVGLGLLRVVPGVDGRGAATDPMNLTTTTVSMNSSHSDYAAAVQLAFEQVQAAVAASVAMEAIPSNLTPALGAIQAELAKLWFGGCLVSTYQVTQPDCVMGDTASATTVALVGDSHAAMWIPAFRQTALRKRWRLEVLAKGACPLMDVRVSTLYRRLVEGVQHCEQWRAQAMARLRAARPNLVVISASRGYGSDESWSGFRAYDQAWIDSLTRITQELRDNGSQVLVLGPVPSPHANVPICLSDHLDDAAACAPPRAEAVNQAGVDAEAAATTAGGGQYVDLTDLFCTPDRCPVIVGNTLVYADVMHLTLEYARLLAPAIGALADRALVPTG